MDAIATAAKSMEAAGLPQLVADAVQLAAKLKNATGAEKKAAVMEAFSDAAPGFPVGETIEALLAFKRSRRWWCC